MGRIQYRVANGSTSTSTSTSTSCLDSNATTPCHTTGHFHPASPSSYFTKEYLSAHTPSHIAVHRVEPIRSSLSAWEDEILLRQNPKGNAARKVGQKIPGFETSAAFFTSLRTNLRLSTSPPPSPTSTPPSLVNSATSLPPPSPLSFPAELPPPDTTSSLLHTPKLTTTLATTPAEKAAALALISASLTHKRTEATRALLLHPLNLTLLLLLQTLLYHSLPPTLSIPLTSILLSLPLPPYLYLAHHQTQPYATRASTLNPFFLTPTDEIFTTLLPGPPSPQRPIATLILRPQPLPNSKSKGNTPLSTAHRKSRNRLRYYQIRAWTVEPAYRRRGLGRKLLETAVETACRRGGEGVVFSSEQVFACAGRWLGGFAGWGLEVKGEGEWAGRVLGEVLEGWRGGRSGSGSGSAGYRPGYGKRRSR